MIETVWKIGSQSGEFFFRPFGSCSFLLGTQGLRPFGEIRVGSGLHSFATSRLFRELGRVELFSTRGEFRFRRATLKPY